MIKSITKTITEKKVICDTCKEEILAGKGFHLEGVLKFMDKPDFDLVNILGNDFISHNSRKDSEDSASGLVYLSNIPVIDICGSCMYNLIENNVY